MTCPDCDGEGVIKFQGCQVTCQKCKGGKTVPTLSEWWALLDTVAELRAKVDKLEEQIEDLDAQVCGVPVGEICRMSQGRATPKDKATITIWLTIEDQRMAVNND